MCLSKAYVNVVVKQLILSSLFGEKKTINPNVLEIDFTANSLRLHVSRNGLSLD